MSSLRLPGAHTVSTKGKGKFRTLRQAQQNLQQEKVDTIPAMLSPGEFVLPQETVQQIGPENLNNLVQQTTGLRPPQGGQPLEGGLRGFENGGELPSRVNEALRRADEAMKRVETPRTASASPPPTSPAPDARERMRAQSQAGRAKVEARLAARPVPAAAAVEGAAVRTAASTAPTAARTGALWGSRLLTPAVAASTAYGLTSPEFRGHVADAARELGVDEGVINATGELAKTYIDPLREKVGEHADAFMTEAEQRVPQRLGELKARIQDAPATRRDLAGILAERHEAARLRREAIVRAFTGQPEPEPTPGPELLYTPESAKFDFNMNPVGPPSPAGGILRPVPFVGTNPPKLAGRGPLRPDPPPPPPAAVLNKPAASDAQANPTTPAVPVFPADPGTSRLSRAELSNFGVGAGASMPAVYADSSVTPEMRAQEADRSRADLRRQTAYFDGVRQEREARNEDLLRQRTQSQDRMRLLKEREQLLRRGPDVPLEVFAMRNRDPKKIEYMKEAQRDANLRLGQIDQALAGTGSGAQGGGESSLGRLNELRANADARASAGKGGKELTLEDLAKTALGNAKYVGDIKAQRAAAQTTEDEKLMDEGTLTKANNLYANISSGGRALIEQQLDPTAQARFKKDLHSAMSKLEEQGVTANEFGSNSAVSGLAGATLGVVIGKKFGLAKKATAGLMTALGLGGTFGGAEEVKPFSGASEELPRRDKPIDPRTGGPIKADLTLDMLFTQPMEVLKTVFGEKNAQTQGGVLFNMGNLTEGEKNAVAAAYLLEWLAAERQREQAKLRGPK